MCIDIKKRCKRKSEVVNAPLFFTQCKCNVSIQYKYNKIYQNGKSSAVQL